MEKVYDGCQKEHFAENDFKESTDFSRAWEDITLDEAWKPHNALKS